MFQVFPSWRGVFAGTQPSLYGVVDSRQISEALRYGLLSFKELDHLLALVQNPEVSSLYVLPDRIIADLTLPVTIPQSAFASVLRLDEHHAKDPSPEPEHVCVFLHFYQG